MFFLAPVVAVVWFANPAHAGVLYDRIQNAKTVVWGGIDYTRARFFVPETFDNPEEVTYFDVMAGSGVDDSVRRYAKPQDAWNDLTKEWNTMLSNVTVKKLQKAISRDVVIDLPTEAGQTGTKRAPYWESQYEARNNATDFDPKSIDATVQRYRFKEHDGIALVFIVERASRLDEQACVWPTWIDLKTKDVVTTRRECEEPGGLGFRNYWLAPIIDASKEILKGLGNREI